MAIPHPQWNTENWTNYLASFRDLFGQLGSTDPDRFPKDARDGNGFWITIAVCSVYGRFTCHKSEHHGGQARRWTSNQVHIELQVSERLTKRCDKTIGVVVPP